MLHRAVQGAASVGADPSMTDPARTLSRLKDRIDVFKYPLENCKMVTNELDDDVADSMGRFGYWSNR